MCLYCMVTYLGWMFKVKTVVIKSSMMGIKLENLVYNTCKSNYTVNHTNILELNTSFYLLGFSEHM